MMVNVNTFTAQVPFECSIQFCVWTGGGLIMVGDGINDAPALAASTVGVVLARRASATAIAVADVLLLQDNISSVPYCIAKARQTVSLVSLLYHLS